MINDKFFIGLTEQRSPQKILSDTFRFRNSKYYILYYINIATVGP